MTGRAPRFHSALFLTASDLVLDLNGQDTSRALERRLRAYVRPHLLALDEIGSATSPTTPTPPISSFSS